MITYYDHNVIEAACARIRFVFDRFERIVISVSSGKDSTVMYHLALREAATRGRKVAVFFLDQEAEWQSSIDLMRDMMAHPTVEPQWFQVPIAMTNATSHRDLFLRAWEPGEEWIRAKEPGSVHEISEKYPQRFYPFFEWHEKQEPSGTAFLVGLRSKESLNRFRAISSRPGYDGTRWSTETSRKGSYRFYPLYDWTFSDIWKFIADERVPYNRYYDRMFAKHGANISAMRVSNLVHEKSFRALCDLQEFEPDTYNALVRRLGGVHAAALYGRDKYVFSADERPAKFKTWLEYRDYLLASTPSEKSGRFVARFAKQANDEITAQQQVKQLLLNDWENSIPILRTSAERLRAQWWDRL